MCLGLKGVVVFIVSIDVVVVTWKMMMNTHF